MTARLFKQVTINKDILVSDPVVNGGFKFGLVKSESNSDAFELVGVGDTAQLYRNECHDATFNYASNDNYVFMLSDDNNAEDFIPHSILVIARVFGSTMNGSAVYIHVASFGRAASWQSNFVEVGVVAHAKKLIDIFHQRYQTRHKETQSRVQPPHLRGRVAPEARAVTRKKRKSAEISKSDDSSDSNEAKQVKKKQRRTKRSGELKIAQPNISFSSRGVSVSNLSEPFLTEVTDNTFRMTDTIEVFNDVLNIQSGGLTRHPAWLKHKSLTVVFDNESERIPRFQVVDRENKTKSLTIKQVIDTPEHHLRLRLLILSIFTGARYVPDGVDGRSGLRNLTFHQITIGERSLHATLDFGDDEKTPLYVPMLVPAQSKERKDIVTRFNRAMERSFVNGCRLVCASYHQKELSSFLVLVNVCCSEYQSRKDYRCPSIRELWTRLRELETSNQTSLPPASQARRATTTNLPVIQTETATNFSIYECMNN